MKKLLGALIALVVLVVAVGVGVVALANAQLGPASEVAQNVQAAATNTVMDVADVKGKVKDVVEQNKDSLAAAAGMTAEEVDAAIADLGIDEWQAVPLPADAVVAGSYDGNTLGVPGTFTLYEDPSYVTLEVYGQALTLAVPESAQARLAALASTL